MGFSRTDLISGPALVTHNGYSFYTKDNVTITYEREGWTPASSVYGALGERHKSTVVKIGFTPAGMYTAATAVKYWPHGPTVIGASVFGATALPTAVVPLVGNKITFPMGAITRMPPLKLSPLATIWGAMEITCLGDPTAEPTDADFWQTVAATSADANFDPTKILSPRFTATLGSVFVDLEPDDNGFDIEPSLDLKAVSVANQGVVDYRIASIGLTAKFRPVALTEAEIDALIKLQGAGAVLPGDEYGTADDLVITGTGVVFTAKKMGAKSGGLSYGVGEFRQGEITFVNKRTYTTGVPDALWTFA